MHQKKSFFHKKILQMSFKKVKRGLSKIFRNSSSNLREIPEEANENGNHHHNPTHHQGFVEKLSQTDTTFDKNFDFF